MHSLDSTRSRPRLRAAAAGLVLAALVWGRHGVRASGHAHDGTGVVGLDVYAHGTIVDLLLAERDGERVELRHRRSVDGGREFGPPSTIGVGTAGIFPPHRGADPQIAAAGVRLVALWTVPGTSEWGSGPLATATSADGGRTWRPGPNPADDGGTGGHGYADLAVDGTGNWHAVWLDSRDGGQGLRAARSTDGGRTWQANRTIDARTCECCWNRLQAAAAGSIRLIYRDRDPRDLAVADSRDGGTTWQRRGVAGAFGWQFEGCPHVGGALAETVLGGAPRLHALVWTGATGRTGAYTSTSLDSGQTWNPPQRLPDPEAWRGDLAGTGTTLAAVWDAVVPGGTAVRSALSTDGGQNWGEVRQLSTAGRAASHPAVVAAGGGFLALWTETDKGGPTAWRSARLPLPAPAAAGR